MPSFLSFPFFVPSSPSTNPHQFSPHPPSIYLHFISSRPIPSSSNPLRLKLYNYASFLFFLISRCFLTNKVVSSPVFALTTTMHPSAPLLAPIHSQSRAPTP